MILGKWKDLDDFGKYSEVLIWCIMGFMCVIMIGMTAEMLGLLND